MDVHSFPLYLCHIYSGLPVHVWHKHIDIVHGDKICVIFFMFVFVEILSEVNLPIEHENVEKWTLLLLCFDTLHVLLIITFLDM